MEDDAKGYVAGNNKLESFKNKCIFSHRKLRERECQLACQDQKPPKSMAGVPGSSNPGQLNGDDTRGTSLYWRISPPN